MVSKNKRPEKLSDLLKKIREAVESGNYFVSTHAVERGIQRGIIRTEYEHVLKTGFHESKKDVFDEFYNTWNYAIRGKTFDKRELRIVTSFDENNLLIITIIDLGE